MTAYIPGEELRSEDKLDKTKKFKGANKKKIDFSRANRKELLGTAKIGAGLGILLYVFGDDVVVGLKSVVEKIKIKKEENKEISNVSIEAVNQRANYFKSTEWVQDISILNVGNEKVQELTEAYGVNWMFVSESREDYGPGYDNALKVSVDRLNRDLGIGFRLVNGKYEWQGFLYDEIANNPEEFMRFLEEAKVKGKKATEETIEFYQQHMKEEEVEVSKRVGVRLRQGIKEAGVEQIERAQEVAARAGESVTIDSYGHQMAAVEASRAMMGVTGDGLTPLLLTGVFFISRAGTRLGGAWMKNERTLEKLYNLGKQIWLNLGLGKVKAGDEDFAKRLREEGPRMLGAERWHRLENGRRMINRLASDQSLLRREVLSFEEREREVYKMLLDPDDVNVQDMMESKNRLWLEYVGKDHPDRKIIMQVFGCGTNEKFERLKKEPWKAAEFLQKSLQDPIMRRILERRVGEITGEQISRLVNLYKVRPGREEEIEGWRRKEYRELTGDKERRVS